MCYVKNLTIDFSEIMKTEHGKKNNKINFES